MTEPSVRLRDVTKRFSSSDRPALEGVSADVFPGEITGLVGPDGAGKTTLIRLIGGLLELEAGRIEVFGHDCQRESELIHERLGYLPQQFGLYEDLTVQENLNLYAELRGLSAALRAETFERLLRFTDLAHFTSRFAGHLSGGMKQKLGLACALIRTPDLLLLDEPSVGVDPLSRRELWQMVQSLIGEGVSVLWSTAYLDEAERCDRVLLLSEGRLLFAGAPRELTSTVEGRVFRLTGAADRRRQILARALDQPGVLDGVIQGRTIRLTHRERDPALARRAIERFGRAQGSGIAIEPTAPRFEDAFIDRLGGGPGGRSLLAERFARVSPGAAGSTVIESQGLTKRFGDFTAASNMTFSVSRGEIFGLLGPNGAGKSTTFKMLCGLLKPSAGHGRVAGHDLLRAASQARGRLGYMAQKFSLYGDLSVRQNLEFFASVYGLHGPTRSARLETLIETFDLSRTLSTSAKLLPVGFKQRLALACAVLHEPEALFLDEPTSGVDPITRRQFWTHINGLVEKGVAVLVTTHFMDEAEYCDRIALIYRGRTIATGSPDALKERTADKMHPDPSLEDAFIALIETAEAEWQAA